MHPSLRHDVITLMMVILILSLVYEDRETKSEIERLKIFIHALEQSQKSARANPVALEADRR